MTNATAGADRGWNAWHFAALLGGNVALALGPLWVRLADTGPVSAGFWRLALAIPFFALLARANGQRLGGVPRGVLLAVMAGGIFFALDLSSWHLGIELTRLGNATLFGNSGSILIVAWGLFVLRRAPRMNEWLAFAAAILGSLILLGRSLEIDGLAAYEIVADASDLRSGLPLRFYQVIAPDSGGYFIFQGLVGSSLATEYLAEFRRVTASFRRNPRR